MYVYVYAESLYQRLQYVRSPLSDVPTLPPHTGDILCQTGGCLWLSSLKVVYIRTYVNIKVKSIPLTASYLYSHHGADVRISNVIMPNHNSWEQIAIVHHILGWDVCWLIKVLHMLIIYIPKQMRFNLHGHHCTGLYMPGNGWFCVSLFPPSYRELAASHIIKFNL